jgi:hypothetical protein
MCLRTTRAEFVPVQGGETAQCRERHSPLAVSELAGELLTQINRTLIQSRGSANCSAVNVIPTAG